MSFEPHKAVYEILDKGDKRMSFPNYISTDAVDYDLVNHNGETAPWSLLTAVAQGQVQEWCANYTKYPPELIPVVAQELKEALQKPKRKKNKKNKKKKKKEELTATQTHGEVTVVFD